MKKIDVFRLIQILGILSGLIGSVLQYFNLSGNISSIAGISILGLFAIISAIFIINNLIYNKKRKVIYGRDKMIERGKKVVISTQKRIAFFGRDLSWVNDYSTEIKNIIDDKKEVLVFYPESVENKVAERISTLKSLGAIVKSTPHDYGLRFTLVESDEPEETAVFLTHTELNKTNLATDYTSDLFKRKDDRLVVDSYMKIYQLVNDLADKSSTQN